jgi:hypothetical protein
VFLYVGFETRLLSSENGAIEDISSETGRGSSVVGY